MPDVNADGGNNLGHSEHKILQNIDELLAGYQTRNRKCPDTVILGTYHAPCTRQKNKPACANDYVKTKQRLEDTKTCPGANYYLYVAAPPKKGDQYYDDWPNTLDKMTSAGIHPLNTT